MVGIRADLPVLLPGLPEFWQRFTHATALIRQHGTRIR